jgi:uncharacterized membrane protein
MDVDSLDSLIDTLLMTQQQMYNKIEFLEKRIKLLEDPDADVKELFDRIREENENQTTGLL